MGRRPKNKNLDESWKDMQPTLSTLSTYWDPWTPYPQAKNSGRTVESVVPTALEKCNNPSTPTDILDTTHDSDHEQHPD
eukprot:7232409-Ditylum_brightwellii.AAC.1